MSRHYAAIDRSLSAILASLPESAEHLVLCGPYLPAGEMRAWLEAGGARVFRADSRGSISAAVGSVRVRSMADWIGPQAIDPGQAQQLHRSMAELLQARFRVPRAALVSPAVCGSALWRSTADPSLPVLTAEQQHRVRSTACQRRDQCDLTVPGLDSVPRIEVWDGRLMYGALLERLPIGPAEAVGELPELPPEFVGRVRVEFAAPGHWSHVGLLPAMSEGGGWSWPLSGEGWCDACEARFAIAQGWHVRVLEGLRLQPGRPLEAWSGKLLRLWEGAESDELRRCLRAIVLQTIGDFQGSGRVEEVHGGFTVGKLTVPTVTYERREVTGARAATAHPEWCAAVWARCRLRMAKAMLSVPRELVLACRTDALYLAGDPGWVDDGRIGRLRRKELVPGPLPAPRNERDLRQIMRRER